MYSNCSQQLIPCNNRRQPSIVIFHTILWTLLSLHNWNISSSEVREKAGSQSCRV